MSGIGRNEQCFCGSGEKHKNCCGSIIPIHPDSVIGQLIRSYSQIDSLLSSANTNKLPCHKGCSDCCFIKPFRIGVPEIVYIRFGLMQIDSSIIELLLRENESIYEEIVNVDPRIANIYRPQKVSEYNNLAALMSLDEGKVQPRKCPFLIDNACLIYSYRPFICRVHGLGQTIVPSTCSKIDIDTAQKYQIQLPLEINPNQSTGIVSTGRSIFTWLHDYKNEIYLSPDTISTWFKSPYHER